VIYDYEVHLHCNMTAGSNAMRATLTLRILLQNRMRGETKKRDGHYR